MDIFVADYSFILREKQDAEWLGFLGLKWQLHVLLPQGLHTTQAQFIGKFHWAQAKFSLS